MEFKNKHLTSNCTPSVKRSMIKNNHKEYVMKKAFITLLVAFAFVGNCAHAKKKDFQGAYLQAGGGWLAASADFNQRATAASNTGDFDPLALTNIGTSTENSGIGIVGIGYNQFFPHNFILGIEATADFAYNTVSRTVPPAQRNNLILSNSVSAEVQNSFGLLLRPGFVCRDSLLVYGLAGAALGNIRTSTNSLVTNAGPSGQNNIVRESYEFGIRAGGGIQQEFSKHFFGALEYDFTSYGFVAAPNGVGNIESSPGSTIGTVTDNGRIKLYTNAVMISLLYMFSA